VSAEAPREEVRWERVGERSELDAGGRLKGSARGWQLLVLRVVTEAGDAVHAVENRCSHQESPLEGGRIRRGHLSCPRHGVRFNLSTGEPLGALTRVPIRTYPVEIVDGFVTVDISDAGATSSGG